MRKKKNWLRINFKKIFCGGKEGVTRAEIILGKNKGIVLMCFQNARGRCLCKNVKTGEKNGILAAQKIINEHPAIIHVLEIFVWRTVPDIQVAQTCKGSR